LPRRGPTDSRPRRRGTRRRPRSRPAALLRGRSSADRGWL
jgi:hypothetical protein